MKKQKVYFSLLFVLMAIVATFSSCEDTTRLQKLVETANKSCPTPMNTSGLSLASVSFDKAEKMVICKYLMDDKLINIDVISKHKNLMRQLASLSFKQQNPDVFEEMISCGAGITYIYSGGRSSLPITISFTCQELQDAISKTFNSKEELDKLFLETQLELTRQQLPMTIAEGMRFVEISKDSTDIVYLYLVDENIYNIKVMKQNFAVPSIMEEQKNNIMKELTDPYNASMKKIVQLCKRYKWNFVYRYKGNVSGDFAEFRITYNDLRTYF